jgi:photosystem II stability/assembly factor-like uncharacterized protein
VQPTSDSYSIDGVEYTGRCNGGFSIPGIVAACIPDFWQRCPKSFSIDDGKINIGLLDTTPDSAVICAQGEAQTHEIWLWAGKQVPSVHDFELILTELPIMNAGAERMVRSGAFGFEGSVAGIETSAFDSGVENEVQNILEQRDNRKEYGYRNYGDTRFDLLPDAWLNGEYDWGHAYIMQYARTGDRKYFDLARRSALHVIDTDIVHYAPPHLEHIIGAAHEHSTHHTTGGIDIGHCWVEGIFELAALLDDTRIRAQAVKTADFFANCVERVQHPRYKNFPGARRPGWGLISLVSAYRSTGNEQYLKFAARIVDICALEQSMENGAWVYPGGGLDDPRYPVGKTFMVALTLTGLKRYHEETNDIRVKEMLLRGLTWAIDWMWDAEVAGFRYIDVPFDTLETSPGAFAGHLLEVLAYAWHLTGDDRYQFVAAKTFDAFMNSKKGGSIEAKDIRGIVPYLSDFQDIATYTGEFPLLSIKEPVQEHIRGFCVGPDGICVAVGLFGLLLESTNDGLTWKRIESGRSEHLYAVSITPAGRCVAVGEGEDVLIKEKPGNPWHGTSGITFPLRGASLRFFYDVLMTDETTGYAGGYAVLAKTEDGGVSWRRIWDAVDDGTWNKLPQWRTLCNKQDGIVWGVGSYSLSATISTKGDGVESMPNLSTGGLHMTWLNEHTGVVCDLEGSIWRSDDGGISWHRVLAGKDALWETSFGDPTCGYACGEAGKIFTTKDGGNNWKLEDSGVEVPLRAVQALSADVALAGGNDGVLLRTADGGITWVRTSF